MRRSEDGSGCWAEPGTQQTYPLSYDAYRRTREAEEKPLARHQTLGAAVDHHVWDRWRRQTPEVEVRVTVRDDAPPRIRRMAGEILRAIKRGQPARQAIRRVSRRFGLRQARAQACLGACLDVQMHSIPDPGASGPGKYPWPFSRPVDWM
jgi:hypothetical protein